MAAGFFTFGFGVSSSKRSESCFFTKVFGLRSLGCRSSKPGPRFSRSSEVAFVANPQRPAYAPPMPFEDLVTTVATAIGFNGHCYDYLFDTIAGMKDCGIRDHSMEKLADAVSQRLASAE